MIVFGFCTNHVNLNASHLYRIICHWEKIVKVGEREVQKRPAMRHWWISDICHPPTLSLMDKYDINCDTYHFRLYEIIQTLIAWTFFKCYYSVTRLNSSEKAPCGTRQILRARNLYSTDIGVYQPVKTSLDSQRFWSSL